MKLLRIGAFALCSICLLGAASAFAANDSGKLSGYVADPAGNPQMGATVWLTPQFAGGRAVELLTDENGIFVGQRLRPGLYSVKVTLAGFMPSFQDSVDVKAHLNTSLHIELDSIFAAVGQLHRKPSKLPEPDDWKWVLRTASSSRPVLQLRDGTVIIANRPQQEQSDEPRATVGLTNGSVRPGASSARPGSMGTDVSYDQNLGAAGKLLMAGEFDYDQTLPGTLGGSVATLWVPGGQFGVGPETTLIVHQVRLGDSGRSIRTMRFENSEQIGFGNHVVMEYGGEYLSGGLVGDTVSSVRPHARVGVRISPRWGAAFLMETDPDAYGFRAQTPEAEPAIDALQTGPVIVWGPGRPVLNGGWHEEFAVHHDLGRRGRIEGAAFRDDSSHEAVFATLTQSADPYSPSGGFLPGPFAHDAGAAGFWGTRLIYREKITEHIEVAGVYAYAGALAPGGQDSSLSNLPGMFETRYRHSVAARLAGKVPKTRTELAASYKWVNGAVVSRQDLYGDASMGIDPNLSLSIRQRLPSFIMSGRWEALADFRNMLGQGYVSMETQQGAMLVMPVERSFRGGLSFQF